jgi:cytochrome c peroxidase
MKKHLNKLAFLTAALMIVAAFMLVSYGQAQPALTPLEELGHDLYFDAKLSDCQLAPEFCDPAGQSCASCHDPGFGFVDPDSNLPVSEGVVLGRFGGRNSPSSAYAMYNPILYFDEGEGLWFGGQFWDGRATGEELGDPLADQALGPFLNPVEMNNLDKATVIADVAASAYAELFEEVWGPDSLDDVPAAYDQVALSIAAFERTQLFAQFSSKYDYYLAACLDAGGLPDDCAKGIGKIADKTAKKVFTKEERYGMQLFMGENNNNGILEKGEGAMCSACHVADWMLMTDYDPPLTVQSPAWAPSGMIPPVFTDFTFDNLGVPKSDHPLLVNNPVDLGLGPVVGDEDENGKFKVMTLRNIGLTGPYAHNGYFEKLVDITHFYNTRDILKSCILANNPKPGKTCWPAPEYPFTINIDELGNLGLSDKDEDAIVEFMKCLTDGYTP